MKKFRVLTTALAAASLLTACGGSSPGDQSSQVKFGKMVAFGDSLSDIGSYKTQLITASGGGAYSINGDLSAFGFPYTNWTEFLAAQLELARPCAAEVGLKSVGQLFFMAQPVVANSSCYSYAQGGARVTNPVGPGNAALFTQFGSASGQLGQITKPLVAQVAAHLAAHTNFAADDLITVMGGGNDVFINRALIVDATVAQLVANNIPFGSAAANAAIAQAATAAIAAMTQAGTELATLVTAQIIPNGGKHIVAVNLPDVSITPDAALWLKSASGMAVDPVHPHLELDMANAFNAAFAAGLSVDNATKLSSLAEVAYVDAFSVSQDQAAHPDVYALTNLTTPACDLARTGVAVPNVGTIPIASSLLCTKTTLITDAAHVTPTDPTGVMHYQYADTVHPTPFGYRLLAQLVSQKMAVKGWL